MEGFSRQLAAELGPQDMRVDEGIPRRQARRWLVPIKTGNFIDLKCIILLAQVRRGSFSGFWRSENEIGAYSQDNYCDQRTKNEKKQSGIKPEAV